MKILILLLLLVLSACATTPFSDIKLLHEVSINDVLSYRFKDCVALHETNNQRIKQYYPERKVIKDAESICSERKLKAFEHELKNGFTIYFYKGVKPLDYSLSATPEYEEGYALVIDSKIVEKYITHEIIITI